MVRRQPSKVPSQAASSCVHLLQVIPGWTEAPLQYAYVDVSTLHHLFLFISEILVHGRMRDALHGLADVETAIFVS